MSCLRTRLGTGSMVMLGLLLGLNLSCPEKRPGLGKRDSVPAVSAEPDITAAVSKPDTTAPNPACKETGKQTVTLNTDDGVKLEADLYLAGEPNGPAAVLLHMIPPHHDRKNYPETFIQALTTRGLSVLNLDRRGAGGSRGQPKDAYRGPKGKLDAKAAYDHLAAYACPIDTERIVYVGASNGTTTALDFAVYAAAEDRIKVPKGLVFLTGGSYTEAQSKFSRHRPVLDTMPILFVYSAAESRWSVSKKKNAGPAWKFVEVVGLSKARGHGTKVFSAKPETVDVVATYIDEVVKKR
jgi:pimeloyl-ACP methyl ester carboxylesterase